jgi:transposase
LDNHPVSCFTLGTYFQVDGKQLQQQYKDHISDYRHWDQRDHAADWMLFSENIGPYLSIDETCLSNGELYTIVTNKAAQGRKGAIVAMIRGTQASQITAVLRKIPEKQRRQVVEVTLDMAGSMNLAIKLSFPNAQAVTDRFHVQQLAFEAVQELRIKYRWEALDEESRDMGTAKFQGKTYQAEVLSNGDTVKQLLARSRYLLFKHQSKWSECQHRRASLLFERYPKLHQAYKLSTRLGNIYRTCTSKEQAFKKLALWYNDIEAAGIDAFRTVSRSVQSHYLSILAFFNKRNTNASAESFNAKIKAFRATSRGVRDVEFFLFRLANIYA